jgi:hypothetical protein
MITKNTTQGSQWETIFKRRKNYTIEEVEKIINSNNIIEQQQLSRHYYGKDGFYTRLINYYATLLKYTGILIPNPGFGKNLSTPHIQKRYFNAVDFVDKLNLPIFLTNCAQRALVDGCYYGLVQEVDKDGLVTLDLPSGWCRTRFKDTFGNDIIEFDVSYFNTIVDNEERKSVLEVYPDLISTAYKKWSAGNASKWVLVPGEIGICFPFFDTTPLFLSVIPATIHYDEAVIIERERDIEEIKKILVQKIPHLNDGRLVFEPDEAEEMHAGAVGMLQGNKNVSVLTTYADVEAIVSKTSNENSTNSIERMYQNVYNEAGTSSQLFASTGSSTLEASINNDTALMMALANKFALFVTNLINRLFANANINFKYTIFPITYYNQKDYIDNTFKLAGSGYSFLMPALAMGFSQRELSNLKDLENDVLKLREKLIPLESSYTQSGANGEGGRPEKNNSEKAGKTLENEKSKDNQTAGGSN